MLKKVIKIAMKERWKVIELKSDILHDVVTVRISNRIADNRVFWSLDTFHNHLRKLKVGR